VSPVLLLQPGRVSGDAHARVPSCAGVRELLMPPGSHTLG
jgi:hypothetical protein